MNLTSGQALPIMGAVTLPSPPALNELNGSDAARSTGERTEFAPTRSF